MSINHHAPFTVGLVAAGAIGSAYLAYYLYKEINKVKIPEKWSKVGTLKTIYLYPIKSCGPVIMETAECSALGLKSGWLRDRVLMVVDDKNNFITARVYPELLKTHPVVRNAVLTITYENMEPLHVNLAEVAALQTPVTAQVWSVPVPVFDCGKEAGEWFSRILNKPAGTFKLMYYASQEARGSRTHTKVWNISTLDTGALPDEMSYNLINEASVTDLQSRLKDCHISPRNFRPNFVVVGALPYDEDHWKFVKIGPNVFEIIKPCTRCVLTTIDPETGVRHEKAEPLETLKSYRQVTDPEERKIAGTSPKMGLQMALRSGPGSYVSVNDDIYVAYGQ